MSVEVGGYWAVPVYTVKYVKTNCPCCKFSLYDVIIIIIIIISSSSSSRQFHCDCSWIWVECYKPVAADKDIIITLMKLSSTMSRRSETWPMFPQIFAWIDGYIYAPNQHYVQIS